MFGKKFVFIFIFFIILITIILFFAKDKLLRKDQVKIVVGNTPVWVTITQTAEEKRQGLSNVKKLNEDEGMLFLFPTKQRPVFWMKEMNFPLDFIWIADGHVVDLTVNLPPASPGTPSNQIPICQPKLPVDSTLEVNAGWIEKNNINVGDGFYLSTE